MSNTKSVGQAIIETHVKNQRESHDRYMFRKYKESRSETLSMLDRIDMLEKRVEELEKRT
jgi:hypothetical protein